MSVRKRRKEKNLHQLDAELAFKEALSLLRAFLVLSAIVGWLLLFYGIIDIVFAFSTRHLEGLWWMQLISGIIMVLLGFWAISPDNATVATYRGAVLLVVWIGVAALFRGISDIIVGFRLRSAHKALGASTAV